MILDSNDSQWKVKARAFMKEKMTFLVENWDITFDRQPSTALIKKFNYEYRLDLKAGRALFQPKKVKIDTTKEKL